MITLLEGKITFVFKLLIYISTSFVYINFVHIAEEDIYNNKFAFLDGLKSFEALLNRIMCPLA